MERREALGPTSLGPRARKRQPLVTGDLPWRAAVPMHRQGRLANARSASRRSIPHGETEKRDKARPQPQTIWAGEALAKGGGCTYKTATDSLEDPNIDHARHQMDS